MTSCGFKSLVGSPCGSSKYQKQASESIILLKCAKDIKGHLKRLNTYDSSLKKEATSTLILARAGVFDVDESDLHLTICPPHRDEYGIRWLTSKKNCACPTNWAPHKIMQRRGDRGITLQQSRLLYVYTSTVVPVASRKYNMLTTHCRSLA
ncbi:Hypothetical predicted protein [Paramuricea clavata]|uniref:Uncharacterized protein n=1 Tax=Paramuricea clavata TaxID=317549 RepID=A0A6S7KJC5_PARCT|nr:Hypothetical predicted protein [Paramuricea clavata]